MPVLVTFKTSAYSDITFFGDAAVSLLKLMGQSGNVPGAIMAEDLPLALSTLQEGLQRLSDEAPTEESIPVDEDEAPPIALHTRAGPLIELLEAAIASNENVMWDS